MSLRECGFHDDVQKAKTAATTGQDATETAKMQEASEPSGTTGLRSVFATMADSRTKAEQNVQMLDQMSETTAEMENSAMNFANMARQIRMAKEKENKFGF
eukprot:SAG31_NODE_1607_length_7760_cov_3.640386_3_plen_101_part_00